MLSLRRFACRIFCTRLLIFCEYALVPPRLRCTDAAGHKPGSGVRVAYFLAQIRFAGRVVIHSVNDEGAAEMKYWLPDAEVHPFGTFEIEIV